MRKIVVGEILFGILALAFCSQPTLDLTNSRVFGPGLKPHVVVLPARYFFVEFKASDGSRWTSSVGDSFKVKITCLNDHQTSQAWSQVLDRKDGSYIIRYKTFESCVKGLKIEIKFDGRDVADSPYLVEESVHSDACDCPKWEAEEWMQQVGCRMDQGQIEQDLKRFPQVEFPTALENAVHRFQNLGAHSFCHYAIKGNKIYRKCYGQHIGFHIFPDAILTSLTRKAYLPDFEFLINLGDWPLVETRVEPLIPIFSWCKTDAHAHADILLPTYELTEASLEAMGRVSLDMMTVQSNTEVPWAEKTPKLFWRGRDSRQERLDLIMLAKQHPDLMNASLTNFFFFRDKMESHGPKAPHISFFKFFDYKYQLNIDGTVAAYRFPFLLAGDAVVLKTDSPYYEHFYSDLQPFIHYVPVKRDLSDLVDQIKWLQENEDVAHQIGSSGSEYARNKLMPLDVICYHMQAFNSYSKLLVNPVTLSSEMELVEQPSDPRMKPQSCKCGPSHLKSSEPPNRTEL